jgi:hypothetical protein
MNIDKKELAVVKKSFSKFDFSSLTINIRVKFKTEFIFWYHFM